jgi:hypothetical protein
MYTTNCSQSHVHPAPHHLPISNVSVQEQRSSNSSTTSSILPNHHPQYMLSHHLPGPLNNFIIPNPVVSSDGNSSVTQQPMYNYQCFTSNQHQHQQPIPMNSSYSNQQVATSNKAYPPTINMSQQPLNPPHSQNVDMPMESEIDNNFTLVKHKHKKKKVKIDRANTQTSSSCTSSTSTPSTSTDNSTSSTNTSSIINNAFSANTGRARTEAGKGDVPDTRSNPKDISVQARRYAETRYAFPPFIIKFKQVVDEKSIIKNISNHFSSNYKFDLNFAGHKLKEKCELLLFVNDRESFAMLFDDQKWPPTINAIMYEKIRPRHLPPQFSIILRNVPTDIDVNILLTNIQNDYSDVLSAHRISNKNNQLTTFVRVDINNVNVIDELLRKKFMFIDNMRLTVVEYLAPAKVLVCTKCYHIGHFRSTCKSTLEFCRTCGAGVADINQHKEICDKKQSCIRCKGPHEANDIRCPNIKSYRAILTKSLLSTAGAMNHQQHNKRANYHYSNQDFPLLNVNANHNTNYSKDNNSFMIDKRIDELYNKMNKIDENLNRLVELNNNCLDQSARIQQVIMQHDHVLKLQTIDNAFQRDFVSQFITPLGQVLVDIIPSLVKQNVINDKTVLCSSLTALCDKLACDLPIWTNRFEQNDNIKSKLIMDYNGKNQQQQDALITDQAHPLVPNQQ